MTNYIRIIKSCFIKLSACWNFYQCGNIELFLSTQIQHKQSCTVHFTSLKILSDFVYFASMMNLGIVTAVVLWTLIVCNKEGKQLSRILPNGTHMYRALYLKSKVSLCKHISASTIDCYFWYYGDSFNISIFGPLDCMELDRNGNRRPACVHGCDSCFFGRYKYAVWYSHQISQINKIIITSTKYT